MKNLRGSILVVEDDPIIRQYLLKIFERADCSVTCVGDGIAAIKEIDVGNFNIVFTDLKMPGISGLQVLEHVKKVQPQAEVVVGTAFGSIENAVEAMQKGAVNYLTKPFSVNRLLSVVEQAFIRQQAKNSPISAQSIMASSNHRMVGNTEAIKSIRQEIDRIARTQATVLIEGETGVGKEIVANEIHLASDRSVKRFVKINCAALPDTLFESELFGYEKGAFTGAISRKKGRIELADGGTLLLDEIGELSIPMQAKLLRVLQHKEIERLGGGVPLKVDVRIIATTNRDLKSEVKAGRFRMDLYFRLNIIKMAVPSLRSRVEDIPELMDYFLRQLNAEYGSNKKVADNTFDMLMKYQWPGNIRELQNSMERAVLSSPNEVLHPKDFSFVIDNSELFESSDFEDEATTLRDAERHLIQKTLSKNGNNKTRAAQTLGITVKTLRNKLKEYSGNSVAWEESSC